jgi:hypothetical protein
MRALLAAIAGLILMASLGAQAPGTRVSIDGERWRIDGQVTYRA